MALRGVVAAVGEGVAAGDGLAVALRSVGIGSLGNWRWDLEVGERLGGNWGGIWWG